MCNLAAYYFHNYWTAASLVHTHFPPPSYTLCRLSHEITCQKNRCSHSRKTHAFRAHMIWVRRARHSLVVFNTMLSKIFFSHTSAPMNDAYFLFKKRRVRRARWVCRICNETKRRNISTRDGKCRTHFVCTANWFSIIKR